MRCSAFMAATRFGKKRCFTVLTEPPYSTHHLPCRRCVALRNNHINTETHIFADPTRPDFGRNAVDWDELRRDECFEKRSV
jgi:hypothetical protein